MASSAAVSQSKITLNPSKSRMHKNLGWLDTHQSFTPQTTPPQYHPFGSLQAIGEDVVEPKSGFPTHYHQNFEIFTYIVSGELTHRDSMVTDSQIKKDGDRTDKFYRMRRNDVQFTAAGTGISHSEMNEHDSESVHLLQIWVVPWKKGITPRYHTLSFDEEKKKQGFVNIISPLKAGVNATAKDEGEAEPTAPNTIPIHADFVMAAAIISPGGKYEWQIGGQVTSTRTRRVYVHVAMAKNGQSKVKIHVNGESVELSEGDGAFIEDTKAGEPLEVESIGSAEAEVIVLDGA